MWRQQIKGVKSVSSTETESVEEVTSWSTTVALVNAILYEVFCPSWETLPYTDLCSQIHLDYIHGMFAQSGSRFFFFWVSISKQMQGKMVTNGLANWDLLLFNSKEAILPQKHTEIIKKLGLLSNLLPAKMHFFLALPLSLPPPFAKWITGKQLYHMNDRILNHGILSWFGNAIW